MSKVIYREGLGRTLEPDEVDSNFNVVARIKQSSSAFKALSFGKIDSVLNLDGLILSVPLAIIKVSGTVKGFGDDGYGNYVVDGYGNLDSLDASINDEFKIYGLDDGYGNLDLKVVDSVGNETLISDSRLSVPFVVQEINDHYAGSIRLVNYDIDLNVMELQDLSAIGFKFFKEMI